MEGFKISKDFGDNRISVYEPSEKEEELLGEVSDKVIDLINSYNLNEDQEIHLISALYTSTMEINGIIGIKHGSSDMSSQAKEDKE